MSPLPKIAFQGEPGANSHEACRTYFPDYEAAPWPTFEEAFEAVKSGACALGMIPVENSIAGRVADVHHLLPSSGLKIIGERAKAFKKGDELRFGLVLGPAIGDFSGAGAAEDDEFAFGLLHAAECHVGPF